MPTISVNTISSYDASNACTVTFNFTGDTCQSNKIIVTDTASAQAVYTNTTTWPTYTLQHSIPAGTLTNGHSYTCTITGYYYLNTYSYTVTTALTAGDNYYFTINSTSKSFTVPAGGLAVDTVLTYDADADTLTADGTTIATTTGTTGTQLSFTQNTANIVSSPSNTWYCFATPTFGFTNLTASQTINRSAYNFTVNYEEAGSELLSEFILTIYHADNSVFYTSGNLYPVSSITYKCYCGALSAGSYHFTLNSISRTFTLTSAVSSSSAYLLYTISTDTLVLVDGSTTTTLTVIIGSTGTALTFGTVVQQPIVPVTGFSDNTQYAAQLTGVTTHGSTLTSAKISFSVDFTTPASFGLLQLENIKDSGSVKITSNVMAIVGEANHTPVVYENSNLVDLTGTNKMVVFDGGFSVSEDGFILKATVINPNLYTNIIRFNTGDYEYSIQCCQNTVNGVADRFYCVLRQTLDTNYSYYLMSNILAAPDEDDEIFINLKYSNGYYTFIITNMGVINS